MSNYNQIFHENLVFFENMNLSYDLYESIDLMLEELSGIFIVSNDEINERIAVFDMKLADISFEELLKSDGMYRKLWDLQTEGFISDITA